jgi:hypothetical protein
MTLNNSMSITPSPPGHAKGAKFEHGSVLSGKTRAARVSSQSKSTITHDARWLPALTARHLVAPSIATEALNPCGVLIWHRD